MTVLVVEDDPVVRLTLADFFESAGLEIVDAANAEEAMAFIADPAWAVDILVTDVNLGSGANGLALAAKARGYRPNLVVVYETGSIDLMAGYEPLARETVFLKPYAMDALCRAVSALLEEIRHERRCRQMGAEVVAMSESARGLNTTAMADDVAGSRPFGHDPHPVAAAATRPISAHQHAGRSRGAARQLRLTLQ